jgi:hypothetical protein
METSVNHEQSLLDEIEKHLLQGALNLDDETTASALKN